MNPEKVVFGSFIRSFARNPAVQGGEVERHY